MRDAGIKVCCGGTIGLGERPEDRLSMLVLLANLPSHPESVPINPWNEVTEETCHGSSTIKTDHLRVTARHLSTTADKWNRE